MFSGSADAATCKGSIASWNRSRTRYAGPEDVGQLGRLVRHLKAYRADATFARQVSVGQLGWGSSHLQTTTASRDSLRPRADLLSVDSFSGCHSLDTLLRFAGSYSSQILNQQVSQDCYDNPKLEQEEFFVPGTK